MMELKDFLMQDHPEQFDFKRLMFDYYEHYKRYHTGDAKYTELLEASKKNRGGKERYQAVVLLSYLGKGMLRSKKAKILSF